MTRIAAVGECMVEFAPNGGDLWRMGFAGDTFNALWTMRVLLPKTAEVDFVSAFGDDRFSEEQLAFFKANGIGTAESPRIAGGRPGLYAITLDRGERSFTYWRSDAVARRLAEDVDRLRASLRGRDLIYFSGITLAILEGPGQGALFSALKEAKAAGSKLAFDPNYRPRLWSSPANAVAAIHEALALADIVLPTFDDEKLLFGDNDPAETAKRLRDHKVGEFVIKNGSADASLQAEGRTSLIPAIKVAQPVDTSGAGDAFNGAYLSARLSGLDPAASVSFAHSVAALAIGVRGALVPVDVLADASKVLNRSAFQVSK